MRFAALQASDAAKVGLVFVDGLHSDTPRVLLTRVKPKKLGESPDLALPRGTRERQDPQTGLWHDPRDLKDVDTHAWRKEPVLSALVREAREEVGVTEEMLHETPLHDVGIHPFTSRKGEQFTVHWFGGQIRGDMLKEMTLRADDASQLVWAELSQLDDWVANGQMNPCYAQVARHAVEGMRRGAFTQYTASPKEAPRSR